MYGYLGCECNGIFLICKDQGLSITVDGVCHKKFDTKSCKDMQYRKFGYVLNG